MDDAVKITNEVSTRRASFNDLFTRMDSDFDRWAMRKKGYPTDYNLLTKTFTGTHETDIDVITNDPRTFCDSVQAILTASERQIAVRMAEAEGEDKREDIGKLERLLSFAFEKADERLVRIQLPPLKDSLVWYSMLRGWLAGRFLVYKDGKDVIFDFLPYDPRWLVYQVGTNGLLWSAYTYFASAGELEDEYGKEQKGKAWYKPWEKKKDNYEVIDYWRYEGEGKVSNGIICEKNFLHKETYDMLSMPILIAPVATRPPIWGGSGNEMGGYGESILAPNRDIDDLLNELGSMWATHANLLAKQPTINYYDDQGIQLKDTAYIAEMVLNLPVAHNKLEPTPLKEISPTLVNLVNWLDSKRVRGSLPDIDIGRPPPSGTLYNLVQETSNRVFNPQLRNLSSFYADICRLTEEQLLTNKLKVNVKIEQKRKYYETEVKPVDLKRPHIIKVEYTARTPWTQLDTYQVADMAKRLGLPDGFIQEHILKLPDPKGLGDLSAIEMAEHSPKLAMLRAWVALRKAGRDEEAATLEEDMGRLAMQEDIDAGQMETSPIGAGETGEAERTISPPA